ncbi:hypothetical protein [Pseudonocardia acaciae]|uniref:hypothetical protein n=1 Tax=Pseudonocardia acaciae TaxID=551276 RepID=UPI000A8DF45A|nr:hypothetical protein [Pseudonocardia acaciae]
MLPRRGGEDREARLDPLGVGLLTAGSALLIVPLIQGRELGWPWWTHAMTAASLVAFGLFVVSERRGRHPVVTPSLFGRRGFVVGLLVVGGFYASLSAFVLVVNLLLQSGLAWTPLRAGLALVPWALGTAVATLASGAVLAERLGRAGLRLGLAVAVVGLLALCWTTAHRGGARLLFIPLFDFVLGNATPEEVGTGAGMLNAAQQFAGAIGVAALGTVFFARAETSYVAAAELVFALCAASYVLTLPLVGLLPEHAARKE